MGILINNMKIIPTLNKTFILYTLLYIIHTSTFTIIHTNFDHYLEMNTKRNNNTEERVSQPQRGYYL